MRLLRRDLKQFQGFKSIVAEDEHAEKAIEYGETPDYEFKGNIQPYTEDNGGKDYGFDLKYGHIVLTTDMGKVKELDKVVCNGNAYQVMAVEGWNSYERFIVMAYGQSG